MFLQGPVVGWGEHGRMQQGDEVLTFGSGDSQWSVGSWPLSWCSLSLPALNLISRKGEIALYATEFQRGAAPWVGSGLCLNWCFFNNVILGPNLLYQVPFPSCAQEDVKSMFGAY